MLYFLLYFLKYTSTKRFFYMKHYRWWITPIECDRIYYTRVIIHQNRYLIKASGQIPPVASSMTYSFQLLAIRVVLYSLQLQVTMPTAALIVQYNWFYNNYFYAVLIKPFLSNKPAKTVAQLIVQTLWTWHFLLIKRDFAPCKYRFYLLFVQSRTCRLFRDSFEFFLSVSVVLLGLLIIDMHLSKFLKHLSLRESSETYAFDF